MKLSLIFFLSITTFLSFGQNNLPQLTNVRANKVGKEQLEIHFDVIDEARELEVIFQVYDPEKKTFITITDGVIGDVGTKVIPGPDKEILWRSKGEIANEVKMRLIVDDSYKPTLKDLQIAIDTAWISDMVGRIEGERHRFNDSAQAKLEEVIGLVKSHYLKLGLSVTVQDTLLKDFEVEQGKNCDLLVENLIASKFGVSSNPEVVLLTSHFDSGKRSMGADDNASGLVASMEIARILSQFHFENTFRFAAFDHGKFGFLGSRFYAIKGLSKKERVRGIINLDMIGYYSDDVDSQMIPEGFEEKFPNAIRAVDKNERKGDFIMLASNINSGHLPGLFNSMSVKYAPQLKLLSLTDTGPAYGSPLGVSDHAIFWMKGYPTIYLGDTGDQRKSENSKDVTSMLDFNRLNQIVKVTLATLIDLAQIKHCTVKEFRLNEL